jgi:hypothetical protein
MATAAASAGRIKLQTSCLCLTRVIWNSPSQTSHANALGTLGWLWKQGKEGLVY